MKPQTIALAGVGDLGRYFCDELSQDVRYSVIVLTRQKNRFISSKVKTCTTDYSEDSVVSILNETGATALISLIQCPDEDYLSLHNNILNACLRSNDCKRFIPSEWAGNIEEFPDIPPAYGKTRAPFREILRKTRGIQWTLFNQGWFMEYFVSEEKSYMKYLPGEFPINPIDWHYCVRGTGDEPQSWTCGRDVAKAVAELLAADEWEPVTYVAGTSGTFNWAAELLEKFYGRPLTRSYRSINDINNDLQRNLPEKELLVVEAELWTITGATACPRQKAERQREKFFSELHLMTIEELLESAEKNGQV
ncbi:uncharacterized protein N7511_009406 [Penicillium nucicola]|uniref:uncharacterized protein n=1 Tax=Penicillium nucicola TaxID=1850975 RepID=UPI00254595BD|nr:uncharacterized protein N7511_009406 [Penicillium nucicola]KAJ5747710.1 hypothetical protein N7511_009406 [Penicillium nucicola]